MPGPTGASSCSLRRRSSMSTTGRLAISHPGLDYQAVLATVLGHGTLIADLVPRLGSQSEE